MQGRIAATNWKLEIDLKALILNTRRIKQYRLSSLHPMFLKPVMLIVASLP
nr:hypothetical protein [Mucilaginibacter humi]